MAHQEEIFIQAEGGDGGVVCCHGRPEGAEERGEEAGREGVEEGGEGGAEVLGGERRGGVPETCIVSQ